MGKLRLTIKTTYGEISVEGDSLLDFRNTLMEIGISQENISNILGTIIDATKQRFELLIPTSLPVASSKPELSGIIEYTSDGTPHITVPTDGLSAKMVIGLLLYAKSPNPVSMSELTELVNNNWKNVEMSSISANLAFMRPFVIKEGSRGSYSYKLSGFGRNWVENEILPKLKGLVRE